jgi:spermidine synthase
MSNDPSSPLADPAASRRWRPALLTLFAASGCAALIYEIVWLQLLQLVIGASAVSLGLLLASFMGGMCLGSVCLARLVTPRAHPLRVYALLELGIGALGVLALFVVPWVGRFYGPHAGHGLAGILLRGAVGAVCLLPPAALMGATFPAIARWVETTPQGVRWVGFFYGANIAGAVMGCLLAGFYLLRVHDMAFATYVAATINGAVALAALSLAALTPHDPPEQTQKTEAEDRAAHREVYAAIALSGLTALSAEVVWTRLLALLLGGTVYAFSIILAVFLFGLGVGSMVGSLLARRTARPRMLLGWCQLLLAPAMAWTAYMVCKSLPNWPVNPSLFWGAWFIFQLDMVRCLWAVLPATMLWGASFPLALAGAAGPGQDPAQLVGRVYAANTVGAILGATASSLLLIPMLGTQGTERLLMALSACASLVIWAPLVWRATSHRAVNQKSETPTVGARGWLWLASTLVVAVLMAWTVPPVPWRLIAHGRYVATYGADRKLLYAGEGMNASVAVTEMFDGVRNFHVSGKVEASTTEQDMRLQRMLGHIPALLNSNAHSVLIVGCGAGVTAGSFVLYPQIQRIVICEIEPLIPKIVTTYFGKENYHVLDDPRVEVVYDDARHYILTTPETFDIITSDPIHPWVKGAATLYTQEYFELCRRHLKPGGLVTQWVPLYESNSQVVKSELATFFSVFPRATIWSNDENGEGYDTVVLGQPDSFKIDLEGLKEQMGQNGRVVQSLQEVGFHSFIGLLATYAGRGPDLRSWLARAEINRDRGLRLQYLAGLGLNLNESDAIYQTMETYRRWPEDLFTGTDQHMRMLRRILDPPRSEKPGQKEPSKLQSR